MTDARVTGGLTASGALARSWPSIRDLVVVGRTQLTNRTTVVERAE